MITINNFGWRLGNQLFQIATAFQHAKKNYDVFVCPEWKYQKCFTWKHKERDMLMQFESIWKEPGFNYSPIPYIGGNMALDGYFQSDKYFNYQTTKEIFAFETELMPPVEFDAGNTCSIHVRRGDYLNHPDHHPVLEMSYYIEAMKLSPTKNFMVFSDDIEWCKQNFTAGTIGHIETEKGFDDLHIQFSENRTEMEDFYLMLKCAHNIIANSSFSWWAAYLNENENKIVISPSKDNWHGPAYCLWNHDDLIPLSWKQITL